MANLPVSSLPLDPVIQEALETVQQFDRVIRMMRKAVEEIIYEDLKEEIRAVLAARGD